MIRSNAGIFIALLTIMLALSGCRSIEEKAADKYQSAIDLAEEGEVERAFVELRTVFNLDGEHRDARMLYADLQLERGNLEEAYKHYLLVSEQYPNDFDARLSLAQVAFEVGAWDQLQRQVTAAAELRPDAGELAPLQIAVDYRDAAQADDAEAMESGFEAATEILEGEPDSNIARRIVIDHLIRHEEFDAALTRVNEALEISPMDQQLNQLKLSLIGQLEDMDALGAQLKTMVARFPENREVRTALVRWFLAQGDADGAEAFVRELVADSEEDAVPTRLALVQFLQQVRGTDAAIEELDSLIQEGLGDGVFRRMRASLLFDMGQREEGIDEVEALVAEASDGEPAIEAKTILARMLLATGEEARAKELINEVLQDDDSNTDALKMRASWLIEADRVRDAMLDLRTALDQEPQDPATLTLLARAYERGGNRELMANSLERAMTASNSAPAETLRYAEYLISEQQYDTAAEILGQALQLAPQNLDLLRSLAEVSMQRGAYSRAEALVERIRQTGGEQADTLASSLQASLLSLTSQNSESLAIVESLADGQGEGALSAKASVIRTHLQNGELERARAYMDRLLAETPADGDERMRLQLLNAALTASEGDVDTAQQIYRELLAESPRLEPAWRALIATTMAQRDVDQARQIIDEAIAAIPDSTTLQWMKAGVAERTGQIEEAIAVYEDLYARDSGSTVVANNLASLLSTYRADEETLQRAYTIARRLRGTDRPEFQDTYGWIAYRLGNYEEAVEYLEPAANAMRGSPTVQYHVAKAYEATGRDQDAVENYRQALDLWGDAATDLAEQARADLQTLEQHMAAPATE